MRQKRDMYHRDLTEIALAAVYGYAHYWYAAPEHLASEIFASENPVLFARTVKIRILSGLLQYPFDRRSYENPTL
jgi:hypothetical protein